MGYFDLGGDGPAFSLGVKDVGEIYEKKRLDFVNGNLNARISLVEHDPNERTLPNGTLSQFDMACNDGVRLTKFPEGFYPPDFKEKKFYYVLRIQRSLFDELVEKSRTSCDGIGFLHPRCKYDRFAVVVNNI